VSTHEHEHTTPAASSPAPAKARSSARLLAMENEARTRAWFRTEVEAAKRGDRSVSVAAQAIAIAEEMGR
jgi:hypothetical protein